MQRFRVTNLLKLAGWLYVLMIIEMCLFQSTEISKLQCILCPAGAALVGEALHIQLLHGHLLQWSSLIPTVGHHNRLLCQEQE